MIRLVPAKTCQIANCMYKIETLIMFLQGLNLFIIRSRKFIFKLLAINPPYSTLISGSKNRKCYENTHNRREQLAIALFPVGLADFLGGKQTPVTLI